MTVLTTNAVISYAAVPPQDTFAYNFRVDKKTDMFVFLDDVDIGQGAFTMTGLGDAGGGTVTLNVPLIIAATVVLSRQVLATQEVDYQPFDAFPAETHEGALDKLTMLVQQNTQGLTRAIQFPLGDSAYPVLPQKSDRENKIFTFDSNGNILLASVTSGSTVVRDDLAGVGDITSALSANQGFVLNTTKEPTLGDPSTDGYVLSSTSAGARSWIPFAVPPSVEILPALNLTVNNDDTGSVFIYDTTLDDDGGKWVDKASTQSWYHEELNVFERGATRPFPKLAIIVSDLDIGKTFIYDGDNPSLPMWMAFDHLGSFSVGSAAYISSNGTVTSVTARNGRMYIGKTSLTGISDSVTMVDFIDDSAYQWSASSAGYLEGAINTRSLPFRSEAPLSTDPLISDFVNDLSLTSSDFMNTVAVATNSGVSIIQPHLEVANIIVDNSSFSYAKNVSYESLSLVIGIGHSSVKHAYVYVFYLSPTTNVVLPINAKGSADEFYVTNNFGGIAPDLFLLDEGSVPRDVQAIACHNIGSEVGLNIIVDDAINYTTTEYVSGFMHGDIKGAWLASSDDADLVENNLAPANFLSGYTPATDTVIDSGTQFTTTNIGGIFTGVLLTIGETYSFTINVVSTTAPLLELKDSVTGSGADPTIIPLTIGVNTVTYTMTQEGYYLRNSAAGITVIDSVTVSDVFDDDRSVNHNPLAVHGTITRSLVNVNSELTVYSGFSAINYLEQNYNTDLDFGTGDFYIAAWISTSTTAADKVIAWRFDTFGIQLVKRSTSSGSGIRLRVGNVFTTSAEIFPESQWTMLVISRISGVVYIYFNGELDSSSVNSEIADAAVALTVGTDNGHTAVGVDNMALLRIGAGAPTTNQINKIYEAEKSLFNANTKCLLQGTSSDIRAMDLDESNNILTVCSANHITKFNGLIVTEDRVDVVNSVSTICHLELTGS